MDWIKIVKYLHFDVEKVVIVFVVSHEDLPSWNTQSFTSDANGGKCKVYEKPPNDLKSIQQFALGMKVMKRDPR